MLFLTVTRKASLLSEMCGSDSRENYGEVVQQMVVAAARLSQEVRRERREGGRAFASLQYGELLQRKVPFLNEGKTERSLPPSTSLG